MSTSQPTRPAPTPAYRQPAMDGLLAALLPVAVPEFASNSNLLILVPGAPNGLVHERPVRYASHHSRVGLSDRTTRGRAAGWRNRKAWPLPLSCPGLFRLPAIWPGRPRGERAREPCSPRPSSTGPLGAPDTRDCESGRARWRASRTCAARRPVSCSSRCSRGRWDTLTRLRPRSTASPRRPAATRQRRTASGQPLASARAGCRFPVNVSGLKTLPASVEGPGRMIIPRPSSRRDHRRRPPSTDPDGGAV